MSNRKCCVPGCINSLETKANLHKFPNPAKNKELFNTWVYAIGGEILHLENNHIFQYRRVCHEHFELNFWCRNNRLTNEAVPTKNMPGLTHSKFCTERKGLLLPKLEASTSKEPVPPQLYSQISIEDVKMPEKLEPITTCLDMSTAMQLHSQDADRGDVQMKDNIEHRKMFRTKIATKKKVKRIAVTKSEHALYRKLMLIGVKLRKCRNKVKKQAKRIKTLQNITTNTQYLKVPQFREHKKGNKGRSFTIQEKIVEEVYRSLNKAQKGIDFLEKFLSCYQVRHF